MKTGTITLTPEKEFVYHCDYSTRHIPKEAGFKWCVRRKIWFTRDIFVIDALPNLKQGAEAQTHYLNLKAELTAPGWVLFDGPHSGLYPYQNQGVEWLMNHPKAILADEMGLGKTPQAICYHESLGSRKTLVLCPSFLSNKWAREFSKWAHEDQNNIFQIKTSRKLTEAPANPKIIICSDTLVINPKVQAYLQKFNYDLMIVDESHRFKNFNAKRTAMVFGNKQGPTLIKRASRVVLLTGTPIPNRPIDLWAPVYFLCPQVIGFMDRVEFGRKYCDAYYDGFGWNFNGGSNLEDLRHRLFSTIMLRRTKSEVLPELPKKTYNLISVEPTFRINDAIKEDFKRQSNIRRYSDIGIIREGDIATRRKELALEKYQVAREYIENFIEGTGKEKKLVVFAHHKELINKLCRYFNKKCIAQGITGETPMGRRDLIIHEFENNPRQRLLILNYTAAGVGLDITKASDIFFIEFPWLPSEIDQAVDRCHRIGQQNAVNVDFLCFKGSMDELMINGIINKTKMINKVIEGENNEPTTNRFEWSSGRSD